MSLSAELHPGVCPYPGPHSLPWDMPPHAGMSAMGLRPQSHRCRGGTGPRGWGSTPLGQPWCRTWACAPVSPALQGGTRHSNCTG